MAWDTINELKYPAGTKRYVKQLWGPVNKQTFQTDGAEPSRIVWKDEDDDGQQWWSGMLSASENTLFASPPCPRRLQHNGSCLAESADGDSFRQGASNVGDEDSFRQGASNGFINADEL